MRSNRVVMIAVLVGVGVAVVTFLGAASMSGEDKTPKEAQKIISPVKNGSKGVVVYGNVDVDNGSGLLHIFPETFPQPCKTIRVLVKEGAVVAKDQPLVEFDPELADMKVAEAEAGLKKAKAALQGAQAQLDQANKGEEMQKIGLAAQRFALSSKEKELEAAKIDLDNKRKQLNNVGAPNDPEFLASQKKWEAAQDNIASEKKKLELVGDFKQLALKKEEAAAGVAVAEAAIELQQSQLNQALYAKKLMTLKAPTDGKIVRCLVSEGMTFGAQTKMPAFILQPKGPVIVRAEVDQEWASRVSKGQEAVIQDDGNSTLKWTGKVLRVSDSFLPKRGNASLPDGLTLNEARVLECIVSIDNDDPKFPVRVGQRVKVSIGVE